MAPLTSALLVLSSLASLVTGHGYLKSITVNGQTYLGWQVWDDPASLLLPRLEPPVDALTANGIVQTKNNQLTM